MSTTTSLLDFILNLFRDPEARAEFQADPEGTLAKHGFEDLCLDDVNDVLPLVVDARSYSTGIQNPPAAPSPAPGESDHETAVKQIENYITNNYTDDRDTIVDNSTNQDSWAGGDVNQTFDNDPVTASGDGAVAAGDDIEGDVVTGDRNAFGKDNVTGDGNTVVEDSTASFGHGDASAAKIEDSHIDDGSAVSVGGSAFGHNTEDSYNTDSHDTSSSSTSIDSHDTTDSYNTIDVPDREPAAPSGSAGSGEDPNLTF